MERKSQDQQGAKITKKITQTKRIKCLGENIHLQKLQQNFEFRNSRGKRFNPEVRPPTTREVSNRHPAAGGVSQKLGPKHVPGKENM